MDAMRDDAPLRRGAAGSRRPSGHRRGIPRQTVVGSAHQEKDAAGNTRQSGDNPEAGDGMHHRDPWQGERPSDRADLVPGLADGEDDRPLLRPRQLSKQCGARRRLRTECETENEAGRQQRQWRPRGGQDHGRYDGRHAGGCHAEGAEAGDEPSAPQRARHPDTKHAVAKTAISASPKPEPRSEYPGARRARARRLPGAPSLRRARTKGL